jgi:peptidoglycan hydrolase-like protein with peptidoglycan-binding domain
MNYLSLVALFLKYGPIVTGLWNTASSNTDFISKIEAALPQLASVAEQFAAQFFPSLAPTVQKLASTALVLNTDLVKFAQTACNAILKSGLEVDGMYGPKTQAAVVALQTQLKLAPDGVFGKLTEAAVVALNIPGLVLP